MRQRWNDMSCSCLRYTYQLHHRRKIGSLLTAHPRYYSSKPKQAADSRNNREHKVSRKADANGEEKDSSEAVANATSARHWLRAILRECTYLPDPKARQYISQYAVSRFRTYDFKTWENNNKKPMVGFDARLEAKQKEAARAVNVLRRANEGEQKPLLKVLFATYGRTGVRRHRLMDPLMVKPAQDGANAGITGTKAKAKIVPDGKDLLLGGLKESSGDLESNPLDKYTLPPALDALVKSQKQVGHSNRTRPNPRKLQPDIPKLNSKMRPMPASRVKNLTKKWYAELLDRVLPPLPEDEWHYLLGLAHGRGLPKQPPRRNAPKGMVSIANRAESALEMVVTRGSERVDKRIFGNPEAHNITPRYMQRLYAIVFRQCPLMKFDSEKGKWDVTWGKYALNSTRDSSESERTDGSNALDLEGSNHICKMAT